MFTKKIEATTTLEGKKVTKEGTVSLYDQAEMDLFVEAGMKKEHCELLNSIVVIRAQDALRKEITQGPKAELRNLLTKAMSDPALAAKLKEALG